MAEIDRPTSTPGPRRASRLRETTETRIRAEMDLDGSGKANVRTRIPFFDHMLTLLARHALIDLEVDAAGDIEVDYHHTIEDTGLVLGALLREALGERGGIQRYGFACLPMDETLARAALDLGGRPFLIWQTKGRDDAMIRDLRLGLFREFFQALAHQAGANIHLSIEYGDEPHHLAEALFKGFARALRHAVAIDPREHGRIASTKGTLTS